MDRETPLTDQEKEQGYRIGLWRDFKNYECLFCAYDTLYLDKMQDHQRIKVHIHRRDEGNMLTHPSQLKDETVITLDTAKDAE